MMPDEHTPQQPAQVIAVPIDRWTRVIVLRAGDRGPAVETLRAEVRSALESGVRELVLDLGEVDRVTAPVRHLVAAAGSELAARGGVVLTVCTRREGESRYLIEVVSAPVAARRAVAC